MSTEAIGALTFEQFERMADEPYKLELLKGELVRVPPPKRKHMEIAHRLYEALRIAIARTTPGIVGIPYIEMGYRVSSASWLRPDVSVSAPDQRGEDYFEGAPIIAIEIVSDSNTAAEMESKTEEFLANGAAEVWMIYPKSRRAWIYRSTSAAARVESLSTPLLPEFRMELGDLLA